MNGINSHAIGAKYVGSSSKSGQVELLGASGNTLISEEVPYTFSSAILSTEGITNGDTCIFTADGESVELTAGENPTGAGGFRGGALRTFGEPGSFGEPGGTEPPDGFGGQERPDFRENTDINSQATPQVESDQETNRIRPESNSDRSGANDSEFGQFRDNQKRSMDEENTASGDNSMIVFWIVISAVALALGLIIVKLFRR